MSVIDDYLLGVNKNNRIELEKIRSIIKRMVPDAIEMISYGIPAFYYKNKYLIGFASLKKHLSIFPESGPIEAFKFDLRKYNLSKGTIRFTADNPLPEELIEKIIRYNIEKINRLG